MIMSERGFTLVEILISLAIFAVVVIGALGVLGAAGSGGFLESFPTGFTTTRVARDVTAASVYLQTFDEYAMGLNSSTLTAGTYTATPGVTCSTTPTFTPSGSGLGSPPAPPGPPCNYPYQLNWQTLTVVIDPPWYACFNSSGTPPQCTASTPCFVKYSKASDASCAIDTTKESLVRIDAKLAWQYCPRPTACAARTLEMDRFLP
jgi:prepilin-type N-terminal cleavage/methylation domain-containing protein